jgi:hypothetical protein
MRDKEPLERTSFSHTGLSSLWSALKPLVVSSRQKLLAGLTVQMIPVLPATLPLESRVDGQRVTLRHVSNRPPPNRACTFPRTRLSRPGA